MALEQMQTEKAALARNVCCTVYYLLPRLGVNEGTRMQLCKVPNNDKQLLTGPFPSRGPTQTAVQPKPCMCNVIQLSKTRAGHLAVPEYACTGGPSL
jgi:hypothetical protein